jgi:hypothetical protein
VDKSQIPSDLNPIIYPLYLIILFTSAIMAGLIIYMSMQVARRRRAQMTNQEAQPTTPSTYKEVRSEATLQKRRERRKKAAAARRRRAGKA